MLRTLALNRHRNQRHLRRLEKRPDPATAMLSRDETRGKRDNNRGGVMWQRSTKERRGNGSYLVLNGPVFGGRRVCGVASLALPRDRTRWCRGGVDLRCRLAVQSVQW